MTLAALIAVGAAAAAGGHARATGRGWIVYRCGSGFANLCRVDPSGQAVVRLTRDGTLVPDTAYSSPSLSLDGARLAYLREGRAYVRYLRRGTVARIPTRGSFAQVSLSPDGLQVLLLEPRTPCSPTAVDCGTSLTGVVARVDGSMARPRPMAVLGADWLGPAHLLAARPSARELIRIPVTGCCGRVVYRSERYGLSEPAVSPDARHVAVQISLGSGGSAIGVITLATGRLRLVTLFRAPGPRYAGPSWSSDGRSLAFVKLDVVDQVRHELYVVDDWTSPRSEPRPLHVRGLEPSWGGSARVP